MYAVLVQGLAAKKCVQKRKSGTVVLFESAGQVEKMLAFWCVLFEYLSNIHLFPFFHFVPPPPRAQKRNEPFTAARAPKISLNTPLQQLRVFLFF